jgi:cytochrome c556
MLPGAFTIVMAAACSGPTEEPASPAEPAAPAGAGWTGLTEPEEVIEARRLLMIETERLMKPIDAFVTGEPADAAVLREDATAIEAMLLAFPHLFPPTTNRYDATVLNPPTIALPAIWQSFDAFLAQAGVAERAAAELIAAGDDASLRAAGTRLRAACDACHAAFAKPYTPPVVTEQDLNFDFESVLPPE